MKDLSNREVVVIDDDGDDDVLEDAAFAIMMKIKPEDAEGNEAYDPNNEDFSAQEGDDEEISPNASSMNMPTKKRKIAYHHRSAEDDELCEARRRRTNDTYSSEAYNDLVQENSDANNRIDELERDLAEANKRIAELEGDKEEFGTSNLNHDKNESKNSTTSIISMKQTSESDEKLIKSLEDRLKMKDVEMNDLKERLKMKDAEVNHLKDRPIKNEGNYESDEDLSDDEDKDVLNATDPWSMKFNQLRQFAASHGGDTRVPASFNQQLNNWVSNQRAAYKRFKTGHNYPGITKERIEKLDSIGFHWGQKFSSTLTFPQSFEENLVKLKQYKEAMGNFNIHPTNQDLGAWVTRLRTEYKRYKKGKSSCLNLNQIQKLKSIGYTWRKYGGSGIASSTSSRNRKC